MADIIIYLDEYNLRRMLRTGRLFYSDSSQSFVCTQPKAGSTLWRERYTAAAAATGRTHQHRAALEEPFGKRILQLKKDSLGNNMVC